MNGTFGARLEVGSTVGGYRILQYVGVTRRGPVWLADRRGPAGFARMVIIRCMPESVAADEAARAEYLDLAGLSARVNHPMVVQVEDVLDLGDRMALVLEYVPGRTLSQIVRRLRQRRQRMRPEAGATVVARVAEALDYAHQLIDGDGEMLSVLHRGLSPTAVVLTVDGRVKMVDCSFLRIETAQAAAQHGGTREAVHFQAPERFGNGLPVDPRADVYAAGALLYELLTSCRPFGAQDERTVVENLLRGQRTVHPSRLNASLSQELADIVWRAMDPDPDVRFQSASELQAALNDFLRGAGGAMSPRQLAVVLRTVFPEGVEPPAAVKPAPAPAAEPEAVEPEPGANTDTPEVALATELATNTPPASTPPPSATRDINSLSGPRVYKIPDPPPPSSSALPMTRLPEEELAAPDEPPAPAPDDDDPNDDPSGGKRRKGWLFRK